MFPRPERGLSDTDYPCPALVIRPMLVRGRVSVVEELRRG